MSAVTPYTQINLLLTRGTPLLKRSFPHQRTDVSGTLSAVTERRLCRVSPEEFQGGNVISECG